MPHTFKRSRGATLLVGCLVASYSYGQAEPGPSAPAPEAKKAPAPETAPKPAAPAVPKRPLPPVVDPAYDGAPVPAPAGALILFDGKDLSKWVMARQEPKKGVPTGAVAEPATENSPKWAVRDGYFEVVPGTGYLITAEPLKGDIHLHVEWATPAEAKGNGQGRGNSGLFLSGFPEIQILDSWKNDTYPDGQAGAFYSKKPPMVNASRGPGEWQCYDVLVERARMENGKVVQKTRVTVRHNNVLVQDKVEFDTTATESTLSFQDHNNKVRFRNIWAAPLEKK